MKTIYAFAVLALMSGPASAWDINTTCTYSRFYGNTCKTSVVADQPRDYAQEAADDRQVEIETGGNMRDGVTVHEDRIRQQQVIHVAAMARNIDDLVSLGGALESLDVAEHHPVVEAIP